jgi:hypothetical protein
MFPVPCPRPSIWGSSISGRRSIPFHSIPFHSIPFHSIPFHSNRYSEESADFDPEAGADVFVNALDAEKAIHAVCAAVTADRIAPWSNSGIQSERIWRAKLKVCSPSETPSC